MNREIDKVIAYTAIGVIGGLALLAKGLDAANAWVNRGKSSHPMYKSNQEIDHSCSATHARVGFTPINGRRR